MSNILRRLRRPIVAPAEVQPIITPDAAGTWSWTWSPELRAGRILPGYHRHFKIWEENPELYEGRLPPARGWARVRAITISIGLYPFSESSEPDWNAIAELIAAREGLRSYAVTRWAGALPESMS
jgi:hypothetical protein